MDKKKRRKIGKIPVTKEWEKKVQVSELTVGDKQWQAKKDTCHQCQSITDVFSQQRYQFLKKTRASKK